MFKKFPPKEFSCDNLERLGIPFKLLLHSVTLETFSYTSAKNCILNSMCYLKNALEKVKILNIHKPNNYKLILKRQKFPMW